MITELNTTNSLHKSLTLKSLTVRIPSERRCTVTLAIFLQLTGDDEQKVAKNEETKKYYSFGYRFGYWRNHQSSHYDFSALQPKHKTIKEEIAQNNIYAMDVEAFNDAYKKAEYLINTSSYIKMIKCTFRSSEEWYGYGIRYGAPLTINHVLSVILYTDYDALSFKFSQTFRKVRNKETKEDVLKRNLEFGQFTKHLIETVNSYGMTMAESKFNVLYHGVSFMYLTKFITTFNGPTSTTTKIQIAYNFAEQQKSGMILELCTYEASQYDNSSKDVRYFNCSAFSNFPNEEERLFITPPHPSSHCLKVNGVRNVSTGEVYNEYIKPFALLQQIIADGDIHIQSITGFSSKDVNSMNQLINTSIKNNSSQYHDYMSTSIELWANTINKIYIWHGANFCKDLHEFCLIAPAFGNSLDLVVLNQFFKNIKRVRIQMVNHVDMAYIKHVLKMLKDIRKWEWSKLRFIELTEIKEQFKFDGILLEEFRNIGWKVSTYKGYDEGWIGQFEVHFKR